jgi:hypothetical protein
MEWKAVKENQTLFDSAKVRDSQNVGGDEGERRKVYGKPKDTREEK